MPNYFAHLTFGARVLAHLPEDLRTSLEGERAAARALLGGEVWADYYQSYFAEAAAYVEANGVEVTGALVYAEADDLLRLWENGDVDKIAIDTVLPSKYSAGETFGWG